MQPFQRILVGLDLSSSGDRLLDEDGVRALRAELLPRARVVTPNIPEAAPVANPTSRRKNAGTVPDRSV